VPLREKDAAPETSCDAVSDGVGHKRSPGSIPAREDER
jgi:hypothetical protein